MDTGIAEDARACSCGFATLAADDAEEPQVTAVMEPATTRTTKTSSAKRGIRIRPGYPVDEKPWIDTVARATGKVFRWSEYSKPALADESGPPGTSTARWARTLTSRRCP